MKMKYLHIVLPISQLCRKDTLPKIRNEFKETLDIFGIAYGSDYDIDFGNNVLIQLRIKESMWKMGLMTGILDPLIEKYNIREKLL